MSHEKVKSICIDEENNKVFINCASNNVRPLSYSREEYPFFSKILKEKGKEAVEIELLSCYDSGTLQDGKNKYTKALKVLYYVLKEEYNKFDWRNNWEEFKKNKDSQEYKDLLKKCLNYKFPKSKFIITKITYDGDCYGKRCLTCMKWFRDKDKATKFDFKEEAENNIFKEYKDVWEVMEI
tara:strand:- start:4280 stop:4822 length:543 start_codon:yes stop_codon:yes gene_type:complete